MFDTMYFLLVPQIWRFEMLVVKNKLIIINNGILQRSHLAALSKLELTTQLSAMYGIT